MAFSKIKDRYPKDWRRLAQTVKDRADWTCQWCGARHRDRKLNKDNKPYAVILTVAHIDRYDTANPDARMTALCQVCHLEWDRDDNARRRRVNEARREHALLVELGQQYLFEPEENGQEKTDASTCQGDASALSALSA